MNIKTVLGRFFDLTPPHEWSSYHPLWEWRTKSGELISGMMMRRKINGVWQYRKLTPPEQAEADAKNQDIYDSAL